MEIAALAISIPCGLVFIFSGLLINLIQACLYLTIRPLSKSFYRRINGVVSEILWLEILWLMEWWAGLEVKIHTDSSTYRLMGKENAFMISNHLSDVDTFILWLLAQRSGCLRRALEVVKKSMQYLPIVGWAAWFFEFVFLDRSWNKDEQKLKASFQGLRDFPRPFWLSIFVEGTRMSPDKLLAAQEFALTKGLQRPKNVLIPRTKGFVAGVQHLRSYVPAIYDVTIAVPKSHPIPSLLTLLKGQASTVYVHIKRYPMKEMPETDEAIAQWCRDRFLAKDDFLKKFEATNTFKEQEIKDFGRRSLSSIFAFTSMSLIISIGTSILFKKFSLLSTWRGFAFLAFGLAIVTIIMHIFIEFTKLPPQKTKASCSI